MYVYKLWAVYINFYNDYRLYSFLRYILVQVLCKVIMYCWMSYVFIGPRPPAGLWHLFFCSSRQVEVS